MGKRAATIFVVDDDAGIRETLRELLEAHGWPVETFASCEAFLAAFRAGREGCLVIDAILPGMDGFGLLAQLDNRSDDLAVNHDHRTWRRSDGGESDAGRRLRLYRKTVRP